ncbi:hypothetical protein ACR3K2_26010 [Cryptosporidium serpentis]
MEEHKDFEYSICLSNSEISNLCKKLDAIDENNWWCLKNVKHLYRVYRFIKLHAADENFEVYIRLLTKKITELALCIKNKQISIRKLYIYFIIMGVYLQLSRNWYNLDQLACMNICEVIISIVNLFSRSTKNKRCGKYFQDIEGTAKDTRVKRTTKALLPISLNKTELKLFTEYNPENSFLKSLILDISTLAVKCVPEIEFINSYTTNTINQLDNNSIEVIYYFTSSICYYRCSGSFLSDLLAFKLPRTCYLLLGGVDKVIYTFMNIMKIRAKELFYKDKCRYEELGIVKIFNKYSELLISDILYVTLGIWTQIFRASAKARSQECQNTISRYYLDSQYLRTELLCELSSACNKILLKATETKCNRNNEILPNTAFYIEKAVLLFINECFNTSSRLSNYFSCSIAIHRNLLKLIHTIGRSLKSLLDYNSEGVKYNQHMKAQQECSLLLLKLHNSIMSFLSRIGDRQSKFLLLYYLRKGMETPTEDHLSTASNSSEFLFENQTSKVLNSSFSEYHKLLSKNIKKLLLKYSEIAAIENCKLELEELHQPQTQLVLSIYYLCCSLVYLIRVNQVNKHGILKQKSEHDKILELLTINDITSIFKVIEVLKKCNFPEYFTSFSLELEYIYCYFSKLLLV